MESNTKELSQTRKDHNAEKLLEYCTTIGFGEVRRLEQEHGASIEDEKGSHGGWHGVHMDKQRPTVQTSVQ
eukprot:2451208-Amphidinium_carterae.1